jgi:RNA polymerase sigma-70 factor (ECF subfamily)
MERDLELALVRRLRAGEDSAFDEIHAAFNARLFSFLARLSRQRDVAEDLLEETWLRVVTHGAHLQPDTHLGAWLFTIARNLYVSYCRSRLLDDAHAASLVGMWPVSPPQPSPFEETAAALLERRIEAALALLPAHSREVLLLVGVEGLAPAEAADICGLTPATLRQRLSRARAQLARRMDELGVAPSAVPSEVTS